MKIPAHLTMQAARANQARVEFKLGPVAQMCLALDDWRGLVKEAYPSLELVKQAAGNAPTTYRATMADAAVLLDDLCERANPDPHGFNHTPSERAACARGFAAVLAAMLTISPEAR